MVALALLFLLHWHFLTRYLHTFSRSLYIFHDSETFLPLLLKDMDSWTVSALLAGMHFCRSDIRLDFLLGWAVSIIYSSRHSSCNLGAPQRIPSAVMKLCYAKCVFVGSSEESIPCRTARRPWPRIQPSSRASLHASFLYSWHIPFFSARQNITYTAFIFAPGYFMKSCTLTLKDLRLWSLFAFVPPFSPPGAVFNVV